MLKRKRKYKCNHCGKVVALVSDKQWIKSVCNDSRYVRLMLVKKLVTP